MNKQRQKEFKENRTSWKFFEKKVEPMIGGSINEYHHIEMQTRLLLEILKELQYLNDK